MITKIINKSHSSRGLGTGGRINGMSDVTVKAGNEGSEANPSGQYEGSLCRSGVGWAKVTKLNTQGSRTDE